MPMIRFFNHLFSLFIFSLLEKGSSQPPALAWRHKGASEGLGLRERNPLPVFFKAKEFRDRVAVSDQEGNFLYEDVFRR